MFSSSTELSETVSSTEPNLNTLQERSHSEVLPDLENVQNWMQIVDQAMPQDYSRYQDPKLLAEALQQVFSNFKRSSRLTLPRDFIGDLNHWFTITHSKRSEVAELLQLLGTRTRRGGCREDSYARETTSGRKQKVLKAQRLVVCESKSCSLEVVSEKFPRSPHKIESFLTAGIQRKYNFTRLSQIVSFFLMLHPPGLHILFLFPYISRISGKNKRFNVLVYIR